MGLVFSLMLSHTQSCKTFLQPMLGVLERGDEAGKGICVVETGKEEKAQLSSSSCSKSCEVQVQDQCVQQAKDRALPRHAWVTTESTSAFLERAVAWQLKLRKAGLEIRCYF